MRNVAEGNYQSKVKNFSLFLFAAAGYNVLKTGRKMLAALFWERKDLPVQRNSLSISLWHK